MAGVYSSQRPAVRGVTHMVAAGHYLATAAGYRILESGGNAVDAGVAAGIVLGVTLPHYVSFGGVAPIMVYMANTWDIIISRVETLTLGSYTISILRTPRFINSIHVGLDSV